MGLINKSLFVLFIFVSSAAVACPNLQGVWTCTNSDGSHGSASVSQQMIKNGVLYRVTSAKGKTENLYADGIPRNFSQKDGTTGTMTVTCVGTDIVTATANMANPKMRVRASFDLTYTLQNPSTLTGTDKETIAFGGTPGRTSVVNSACSRH